MELYETSFLENRRPESLRPIGPLTHWEREPRGVRITAGDGLEVRLEVLAADLVRVRASLGSPLKARDHSWAIARSEWGPVELEVTEDAHTLVVRTAAMRVTVRRDPFLVDIHDATGAVLVEDGMPMRYDPSGSLVAAAKRLGFNEHFYGLGEKAARLDRRRGRFVMWNTDSPGYKEGTDPLYQSIPFYIGLRDGRAYGLFYDNSHKSLFDLGTTSAEYAAFSAAGGEMDYYLFAGPDMKRITGNFAALTGAMPMPPRWALGNQQSRWSYVPASTAEAVVKAYRDADLPLDAIHLDIDYMDEYRVFTWDSKRFPDPAGFVRRVGEEGVKVVTIVDPGVKYDPGRTPPYRVFDEGVEGGHFLKRKNGELFRGRVWPESSVFVDYTRDESRRWWGDLHKALTDVGVAGVWNDMNEPADFDDRTGATHEDVVSFDGGEKSPQGKNRNTFALLMARATREGLLRLRPNERPYVITRAGYAGIQRFATMWTGDNCISWESLALSLPMFQSLGLSGQPFVGADIGGFMNGRGDSELLVRWYQVGFLTPFCRNHQGRETYDHEPFRLPPFYQNIVRDYLKLRYRLLPYLYTVLEEAHRTGVPWFRPLVLEYQDDAAVVDIDDQFLVGRDILVAPVLSPGREKRHVYLPRGTWQDYWTGKRFQGPTTILAEAPLEKVPMYLRGGSAIPFGPDCRFVDEKPDSPLRWRCTPDDSGRAEGTLYEDDGRSLDYERGVFRRSHVVVESGRMTVTSEGLYEPPKREWTY